MIKSGSRTSFHFNPFFFLFFIYLIANTYSFLMVSRGEAIYIDQLFMGFEWVVALNAFLLLLVTLFFILLMYVANSSFPVNSGLSLSTFWGVGMVFFQLCYFANSFFYGTNIAGVMDEAKSPFQIVFTILDPDVIFFIVAVLLRSSKLFWVNALVYLVSTVLRGWGGGFILIPILILCRYYKFGFKFGSVICLFLAFIILFLISPFLIEIKWLIRAGGDVGIFFSNIIERGYFSSLLVTFEYLANRFQMFGHVSLIVENNSSLAEAYENNEYIPYWADGLLQWVVLRLNGVEIFQINRYMVSYFFGADNSAYSTNPGIAGWLSVLGGRSLFLFLYVSFIVFFPAYIIRKYAGLPLFFLCYCFVLVWLFHGWVGAYVNFITYVLCILFLGNLKFSSKN